MIYADRSGLRIRPVRTLIVCKWWSHCSRRMPCKACEGLVVDHQFQLPGATDGDFGIQLAKRRPNFVFSSPSPARARCVLVESKPCFNFLFYRILLR